MESFLIFTSLLISSFANPLTPPPYERIVTDEKELYNGVPVDYRYNETKTEGSDGLNSVPGCPKSEAGYPWVYLGTPSEARCYLSGEKGPCDWHQLVFIEEDTPFGFCNCECFKGKKREGDGAQFCKTVKGREMVFTPDEKKCYMLYEQGPCENENEWLAKVELEEFPTVYGVKCEERKCPSWQYPIFEEGSNEVSCATQIPVAVSSPSAINPNDCEKNNMKYSQLLKKCVDKFDVNFG